MNFGYRDGHEQVIEIIERLPVTSFSLASDSVREDYVNELKTISIPEALKEFVKRWWVLWEVQYPNKKTNKLEPSLLDGSFDAEATLKCIEANRKGDCEHVRKWVEAQKSEEESAKAYAEMCIAPEITIPGIFLFSSLASILFMVPFNTALAQTILAAMKEKRNRNELIAEM
jgi:enhancing lycopene biosynthesis protein 2